MQVNELINSDLRLVDEAQLEPGVLARVRGKGFVVNGESQNKRFYSKQLWETAIERSKGRLADRTMFGFLGHQAEASDETLDTAALVVTELSFPKTESDAPIDGTIEYIIPDTSKGRALNALLRVGSKLSVSSRALGESKGKTATGSDIIEASTYRLLGFDIVKSPGVKYATPQLQEMLEALDEDALQIATEFLGESSKEKPEDSSPSENLNNTSGERPQGETMTISLDKYEAVLEAKTKTEGKLQEALDANRKLTDEAISTEALETAVAATDEAGAKLEEAGAKLAAYEEHGTAEDIASALTIAEEFQKLGTVEEVAAMKQEHAAYAGLGSVEDITEAFDNIEKEITAREEANAKQKVESLATKHKVEESVVLKLVESGMSDTALDEVLDAMTPSATQTRYSKQQEASGESVKVSDRKSMTESLWD